MKTLCCVWIGGGLGSVLRYGTALLCAYAGCTSLYTTLCVNVLGSGMMGFVIGTWAVKKGLSSVLYTSLTTGFLGGFTTYSAFSGDVLKTLEKGACTHAVLYVCAMLLLGWVAVYLGHASSLAFWR